MSTIFYRSQSILSGVIPISSWNPDRTESEHIFEYIDIAAVDRDSKQVSATTVNVADAPSRARQIVKANDVLVSTVRPNLNAVALVPEELDNAIASTGFCVLRCQPKKLDHRYLFHWVRTPIFVVNMVRQATGASYPAVSDRIVKESEIPLPYPDDPARSLSEQKRIADILDKADAIRRKWQEAHDLTEDMPFALFRETFRGFLSPDQTTTVLTEAAEVASGVAKGRKLNGTEIREVPYLRVANVQAGYLNLSEIKTIPATESEIKTLALQHGDVVMTEGGDFDKLGRGALWEHEVPDCIHQNHVFRVRTDHKKLLPTFFVHYLQTETVRAYFLRCAKKTTNLASINMTQLRALPVPLPSLNLQEKFDKELRTIIEVTQRQIIAEKEANDLFNSLVQRAFRGEL